MQVIDFLNNTGYTVTTFPDGEKHLKINDLNRKDTVAVRCRIKSSDDIFLLMQLSDILNRQCVTIVYIEIFYLMSMRCDRLFSFEQPFTLKIVSDVINSFNAKLVKIIEPHSSKALELINNSRQILSSYFMPLISKDDIYCFPDNGAAERYYTISSSEKSPLICSKKRDADTGKLSLFEIIEYGDYKEGDVINVYDDLCDGGGTFCGIADLLRELKPKQLNLFVTHAIQKSGIENIARLYDNVYITNSYNDWNMEELPNNVSVVNIL